MVMIRRRRSAVFFVVSSSSSFAWRGSLFAVSVGARPHRAGRGAGRAGRRPQSRRRRRRRAPRGAGPRAGGVWGRQGHRESSSSKLEEGRRLTAAATSSSSSSADAARAAADARSLALAVTGAALDAALERGRLATSLLSRALDGGEKEAATILKVKQAALAASGGDGGCGGRNSSDSSSSSHHHFRRHHCCCFRLRSAEKKKKQQRRRAAAAAKRPAKPEDAVRAFASLAKTAKQLGEVAAALGGTTGELLLDEAAALGADASARRTFWAARAFLASRRCPDAMALLDRARERAEAAAEAHEECSRPDNAAVLSLRSLAEDACPGWKAVAHAEAAARTARGVRAAGAKVAGLKVAAKRRKRRGAGEDGGDDDDEKEDDEEEEEQEREPKRPFLMDRWTSGPPARPPGSRRSRPGSRPCP